MDQIRDTDFNLFAYLPSYCFNPSIGEGVDVAAPIILQFVLVNSS